MKTSMRKLLAVLTLFISAMGAHAGSETGNGGGTWVCRELDGSLRWAKLADLFEAENEHGFKIDWRKTETMDEHMARVEQKLLSANPRLYVSLMNRIETVRSRVTFSPAVAVADSGDADFTVRAPLSLCPGGKVGYEQVAVYKNYDRLGKGARIFVDTELWNALSSIEQAALYFHEAAYLMFREIMDDKKSTRAREAVAVLFSTETLASYAKLFPAAYWSDVMSEPFKAYCHNFAVPPRFEYAGRFSGGLAPVSVDRHRYGYIDTSGKFVIEPRFYEARPFHGELALAAAAFDSWGLIDRAGEFFVKPIYHSMNEPTPDSGGYYLTSDVHGNLGLLSQDGKTVLSPRYNEIGKFSEGLAPVRVGKKFGVIDQSLREVLKPIYDDIKPYSDGLARVKMNGKVGFINRFGQLVIGLVFSYACELDHGTCVSSFSNGLAAIRRIVRNPKKAELWCGRNYGDDSNASVKRELYGFIDKKGQVVIKPQYAFATDFSDDRAIVAVPKKNDDKCAFQIIDRAGRTLRVLNEYLPDTRFESFVNGLALGSEYNKFYINTSGVRILGGMRCSIAHELNNGSLKAVAGCLPEKPSYTEFTPLLGGVIDAKGQWVVGPLDHVTAIGVNSSEGKILIHRKPFEDYHATPKDIGFVALDSRSIVVPPVFATAENFHEGLAVVGINVIRHTKGESMTKYGYIRPGCVISQ